MEQKKTKISIESIEKHQIHKDSNIPLLRSNAFPDFHTFCNENYIVFRTARFHFPTRQSKIVIYKQTNTKWSLECVLQLEGKDVRDPKLFVYNEQLCLIFVATPIDSIHLGLSAMYTAKREKEGSWTKPVQIKNTQTLSPFRIRYIADYVVLSSFNDCLSVTKQSNVSFFRFIGFDKLEPYEPFSLLTLNGSETDFVETDNGFYFVVRMDKAVKGKMGSRIIFYNKETKIISSKLVRKRFDAPFLFILGEKVYMLSRSNFLLRNYYDILPPLLPSIVKTIINTYFNHLLPKQLVLWEIKENMKIKKIKAFSVFGDTGYAVVTSLGHSSLEILTYANTSRFSLLPWFLGQFLKSYLYSIHCTLKH